MIITDKTLEQLTNDKKLEKLTTLYFHNYKIDSIDLSNKIFTKLEFLSIQNNNITNIDFIKSLPNLWYFDVRNNPLENYESLNIKNVFGFLGLPVDKYCEKSLLQVKRLCVGMISVNLDENLKKYFLSNNPNILIYNDELIYEIDKTFKRENMSLGVNPSSFNRKSTHELPSHSFGKISNSYVRKTTTKSEYLIFNSTNNFSEKIISLLKFFNDLNIDALNPLLSNKLNTGISSDSNQIGNNNKNGSLENIDDANFNSILLESPVKNKIFRDENNKCFIRKNTLEIFSEHEAQEFLKKERSKLIYISMVYQSFLELNNFPNHLYNQHSKSILDNPINYNFDLSTNLSSSNKKNKNTNYFKLDSLKVKDLKLQIAICTVLGLYFLQVINKNICYVILKFICNKFKLTQNDIYCINSIKNILELKTEILLGLYFSLIESLKNSKELKIKYNSKLSCLIKTSNSFSKILVEEENKGFNDFTIQNHINTSPVVNNKNNIENNIIAANNDNKEANEKDGENLADKDKEDLKNSEVNHNLRWEEMIKVLGLENLILNISKISQRNSSIYQIIDQNKNEDRKKFILINIIKPLDELYNLFDEALVLVQYLSDFIKMNNFHDMFLAEFTKDYRYFLETKDVFFQYLNNKYKKNLVYDSLTDRIFCKHKQNSLGNSIFFKLKEKKIEEKLAEHENNLSLKRYFHNISGENIREDKKFFNSMSNFNKSKLSSNKDVKIKTSFNKTNSNFIENKENNLKKFDEKQKLKEISKNNNISNQITNYPQNFVSKKHFYSQIKKNEQKKENMEKIKDEEEKRKEIAKRNDLKGTDLKPLLGLLNKEKNNRNEVEKEQTFVIRNIRSKYSDNVRVLINSERKRNNNIINNEGSNLCSRSFDKISDYIQDNISWEKNLNNSKVKYEYFHITQENEALNNKNNLYKSSNFLLTQIVNNENAVNENLSENEYKLIPKNEFNKKHKNFFHNELYKVKINKNIDNNQDYKIVNEIDQEVSDYLKTMKLNINNKSSSSLNFHKRENNYDFINENNKNSSNLIVWNENNDKGIKRFYKTTQDFYPKTNNYKSSDNIKKFNDNLYKINKNNNFRAFNAVISRNSGNMDQMNQSNQQEYYLSRPDSPEKFRKTSNNFLFNSVKIKNNEDQLNLNNFRMHSPKYSSNQNNSKIIKSVSLSIKPLNNFRDNNIMLNNHSNNNANQNCSNKMISNFATSNLKIIDKNKDNLDNFKMQNKPENKQKTNNNLKELFRNSQNTFFNNPNKIVLDRKLLKSYNPRRIIRGLENEAKDQKNKNKEAMMLVYEKEEETQKKKIKITSIFPRKEMKEKSLDKNTFLDFRSNYRKLVHRWNRKNPHHNNLNNKVIKENDFFKVINKQKKQNLNIMSAKDINQLFSISNKDEEIFNQIFAELDK